MAQKLNPFYQFLNAEVPINITLKVTFDSVNKTLSDACELILKQSIRGQQLVLMTDATFRSAGYALKVEDNPNQMIQSKNKFLGACRIRIKRLLPRTTENVNLLGKNDNLHGISQICANFVEKHQKRR